MPFKRFILALILLLGFASVATADGGFTGLISYKPNEICDCTPIEDRVLIYQESTGLSYYCGIRCAGVATGYNTELPGNFPHTFPPGWYRLSVDFHDNGCKHTTIQRVYHSDQLQTISLEVFGDYGTPSRPGGE